MNAVPLLAPRAFRDFSASEYKAYVKTLYAEPVRAEPARDFAIRRNERGTLIITVRRNPRQLTQPELRTLAQEAGLSVREIWNHCIRKKIAVEVTQVAKVRRK